MFSIRGRQFDFPLFLLLSVSAAQGVGMMFLKLPGQSINQSINNLFTHVNAYEHKCSFKIRTCIKTTVMIKF